jgi:hypothetical protein
MRLRFSSLCVVSVLSVASAWAGSEPSASAILEHCLASQQRLRQFQYECDTQVDHPISPDPGRWAIARNWSTVRRDGSRFEAIGRRYSTGKERGPNDFQYLVVPGRGLVAMDAAGRAHQSGMLFSRATDEFYRHLGDPLTGGCLDGYLEHMGNRHLCQLMLDSGSAVLAGDQLPDSVPCHVIRAKTAFGNITVWISKESSALVAFDVEKQGSDLHWGKGGGSEPFSGPSDPIQRDLLQSEGADWWTASLRDVHFAAVNGTTVASRGTLRIDFKSRDRTTRETVYRISRESIKVEPVDFGPGAFTFSASEGAVITDQDNRDSGVQLVWHNGDVAIAGAESASKVGPFSERSSTRRLLWLVVANVCVLSIGVAIWLGRRLRRRDA